MASTYKDNQNNTNNTNLSKSVSKTVSGNNAKTSSPMGNGKGAATSKNYSNAISSYMSQTPKFKASSELTAAQDYLKQVTDNKPGSYVSKYTSQLDDMYNQLMNRGQFEYDMNGDMLYKQYQQRYTEAGKRSMRDTMGQAAAQTGGYGSSYAQTAGQDAYGQYMQQLQNAIPELANQAQERYNNETQNLQNKYNLVSNADQTDYSRYRDTVADWQDERTYAANEAQRLYENEYNQYSTNMNTAMQMASWARDDASNSKSNAMNQVNLWIQSGVKPSKGMVEKAGLNWDQFQQYWKKVK